MPMQRHLYPKSWPTISLAIRERAGWRCEWVEDGIRCEARQRQPNPRTGSTVVLTVAHYPDVNPANCDPANLLCLCQMHHLRLDAPLHAEHARQTRARRRQEAAASAGQQNLWGNE